MQEFLTNNTVSWNLMSLTGYRTLIIFHALLESPKTNDEINEYLFNNQYIREKFSADTLRLYINSLREIGCKITRANKANNNKYTLLAHPFTYDIPKPQLKAIAKLHQNFYDKVDLQDLIKVENFLRKLSDNTDNLVTKNLLLGLFLLKNIDKTILSDLILHCNNKNQIVFTYNSPKSGPKNIEIIADKLFFNSAKLYLWGQNITHGEYSYFLVEKILKINEIKLKKIVTPFPATIVKFEVYNESYTPSQDEVIIEKTADKIVLSANVKNEFQFLQKMLSMAHESKIIEPEALAKKMVDKLAKMRTIYD